MNHRMARGVAALQRRWRCGGDRRESRSRQIDPEHRAISRGPARRQSRRTVRGSGRGIMEEAGRAEERIAGKMRSRPRRGRGARRLRATAALFQGYRQGAGRRIARAHLHGDAAGNRRLEIHRGLVRQPGEGRAERDRDLHFRHVEGHAASRSACRTPRNSRCSIWASACSTTRAARTISPARPATVRKARASACRNCRTYLRRKARPPAGRHWPAYRVSAGQMWGMQWRLADCFRQQRFPEPIYASDVTVALSMFMAATANGATMDTPGIKR